MTKPLGFSSGIGTHSRLRNLPLLQPALLMPPYSVLARPLPHQKDTGAYRSRSSCLPFYGLGWLSMFVFTCTLGIVVIGELAFRLARENLASYLYHLVAAIGVSFAVMLYLGYSAPLVVVMGVVVAVLLRAVLRGRDDALMIEALGVAMTMFLFEEINFEVDLAILAAAAIIAFGFGYTSYRFRVADISGLFSGAMIGIILIVFADVRWFLIMLTFFIIGAGATRYRYGDKEMLGVAQEHGGVRGYFNVFANGLVATAAAILYGVTGHAAFVALFGSVASAAGTTASGSGVTGKTPLIDAPAGSRGRTAGDPPRKWRPSSRRQSSPYRPADGCCRPWMVVVTVIAGFIGTNVDSVGALGRSGRIGTQARTWPLRSSARSQGWSSISWGGGSLGMLLSPCLMNASHPFAVATLLRRTMVWVKFCLKILKIGNGVFVRCAPKRDLPWLITFRHFHIEPVMRSHRRSDSTVGHFTFMKVRWSSRRFTRKHV